MDILENVKMIRALISKETPDNLFEPLDVLFEYVLNLENMTKLNADKQLRRQIADCFLLGGNQILAMLPQRHEAHFFLAVSHLLNDDTRKLCQSLFSFFREANIKNCDKTLNSNDVGGIVLFFYGYLTDKTTYIDSISKVLEKAYPGTAVVNYTKSLSPRLNKEQVMNYLSEAIAIDKNFALALSTIAETFQNVKNWKAAISYYNRCIELNFADGKLYFDLALCYEKIKDHANEIASYQKCLECDPEYQFAMNNLGWAYEKAKDYEQALSCYQKSMLSGRDETYPFRNYFRLLKKLKRYDEAIAFWETNKKNLPPSFQKDVDTLRETKNEGVQKQVLILGVDDQSADDESAVVSEQPRKSIPARAASDSFLAESHLEEEIEERMNRGLSFFDGLSLKVYEGRDGYGRQYIIPGVGRIDILAVNTTNNDLYVIELKRGLGDDEVIGQVSRYMGWVKKNLAADGQNVYGIVCIGQASEKLKYAAEANPNIRLYIYGIQVTPI